MKLQQTFVVARPEDDVWAFFHDIPAVTACLPGAEYLGDKGEGIYAGKMSMKVGPFQASFDGEANVDYDDAARTVTMQGKGVDKKGASRGKMSMVCNLTHAEGGTGVAIDADVQLSGAIAQFGRTGIIHEIANVLIADFVRNVEARLPAGGEAAPGDGVEANGNKGQGAVPPQAPRPVGGLKLLMLSLLGLGRGLFGRKG
ncbi:MAG: SRPBCC family protein [Bauldia litoralis]